MLIVEQGGPRAVAQLAAEPRYRINLNEVDGITGKMFHSAILPARETPDIQFIAGSLMVASWPR
jgi:hypothetical protein